jgi:nitrite reductase/ring-hydroxylating ferredoxin subunit/uncharacterized membrane protein
MALRYQVDRLEDVALLDPVANLVAKAVGSVLPDDGPVRDALHGTWLGHPAHPMLTDLPIGFWTSGFVLDLFGRRARPAADAMIGLGVLSAVPTIASGWADWLSLGEFRKERRVGLVHAVSNGVATGLFAASYVARKRGRRGKGIWLTWLGSTAATVGGYLGGHLAFRQRVGTDRAAGESLPREWTIVIPESELVTGKLTGATVGGTDIVLLREGDRISALVATCSHMGGPLAEGRIERRGRTTCVVCPWHDSTFAFDDGRPVTGPASAPQPVLDVRVRAGQVEVRGHP